VKPFYEPFEPGQHYTFDEFMALEKTAEARHEFYEGQAWMFPPDTLNHNRIVRNCLMPLFSTRKSRGYEVFTTGMMLEVLPGRYYTYPDLMVLDASHYDNDACVLHNPRAIIEVLDPLWAERDRAWKCTHYRCRDATVFPGVAEAAAGGILPPHGQRRVEPRSLYQSRRRAAYCGHWLSADVAADLRGCERAAVAAAVSRF
jgi:hypothetical protein